MSFHPLTPAGHDHTFGHAQKRPGETATQIVIAITAVMMVVEIAAGLAFGSMALLADGLHMASHALALGIAAFAYVYARRHADDPRFSFGTGKVSSLSGFTSALLLLGFASVMAVESVQRLLSPVDIAFGQAILVAVLGLVVNGVSMFLLGGHDHHGHHGQHGHHEDDPHSHAGHHDHGDEHEHDHEDAHGHSGGHDHGGHHHHGDHNLRAAYLHVLADALTSLLAIFALLAARYLGWQWMDPLMGIVGAILVARWSLSLIRQSGRVLLDFQGPAPVRAAIRRAIEAEPGSKVTDLHLWVIGPDLYALEMAVCSATPRPAAEYRARLPAIAGLAHVNIEVHGPDGAGP